jgi:hypothetical protein
MSAYDPKRTLAGRSTTCLHASTPFQFFERSLPFGGKAESECRPISTGATYEGRYRLPDNEIGGDNPNRGHQDDGTKLPTLRACVFYTADLQSIVGSGGLNPSRQSNILACFKIQDEPRSRIDLGAAPTPVTRSRRRPRRDAAPTPLAPTASNCRRRRQRSGDHAYGRSGCGHGTGHYSARRRIFRSLLVR